MSTMEIPACLALLLVMANLALCLSADTRRPVHPMDLSSIETIGSSGAPTCSSARPRTPRPC